MTRAMQVGTMVGTWYDAAWTVVAVVGVVLLVVALRRWFSAHGSGLLALVEVAVIWFVPILGPAAYLLATAPRPPRTALDKVPGASAEQVQRS